VKYRFIIIDEDGDPSGTNDDEVAEQYAHSDCYLVLDCKLGTIAFTERAIPKADPLEDEEDEEEEEKKDEEE